MKETGAIGTISPKTKLNITTPSTGNKFPEVANPQSKGLLLSDKINIVRLEHGTNLDFIETQDVSSSINAFLKDLDKLIVNCKMQFEKEYNSKEAMRMKGIISEEIVYSLSELSKKHFGSIVSEDK